jgi:hypothetical protein
MRKYYHHDVRTTLTLDQDVAARVQREMRRSGMSFKETVNTLLRRALNTASKAPATPFKIRAYRMGERSGLAYDDIGGLLERLEGSQHR